MPESTTQKADSAVALVVEDEPLYRMQTADLLWDAGFEVIETNSAAAALEHFEAYEAIALLFTDIRMPGLMDGAALAHEVTRRWPQTHIIVCSAVPGIDPAILPDKAVFFDKPYQPEHVLSVVQRATSGSGNRAIQKS